MILLLIPAPSAAAKPIDLNQPLPWAPPLAKLSYKVHSTSFLCISLALLLITVPASFSWQLRHTQSNLYIRILTWCIILVAVILLVLNLMWIFYWTGRV